MLKIAPVQPEREVMQQALKTIDIAFFTVTPRKHLGVCQQGDGQKLTNPELVTTIRMVMERVSTRRVLIGTTLWPRMCFKPSPNIER
jgi:hypothetical protein